MEQARRVIERLDRIDELQRVDASPAALLREVRALLAEAEEWVRAEPQGTNRAESALDRAREALACRELVPGSASRTLLA